MKLPITEENICSCFYRSFEIASDFNVYLFVCVVHGRAEVHRAGLTQRAPELDPALIQQLRDRCDEQARQLQSLQAQFNRTSLCLDVFSITTQHFCHKVGMPSLSPHVKELWVAVNAALNQAFIASSLHLLWEVWVFLIWALLQSLDGWCHGVPSDLLMIDGSVLLQCEITTVSGYRITGLKCLSCRENIWSCTGIECCLPLSAGVPIFWLCLHLVSQFSAAKMHPESRVGLCWSFKRLFHSQSFFLSDMMCVCVRLYFCITLHW